MNESELLQLEIEHRDLVRSLKKEGDQIAEEMTDEKADAIHMIMGICGEAGELLDAVKKWTIYGKPLDLPNIIEELGDLEFYLEGFRQALQIRRFETIGENVLKLKKRYPSGVYTNKDAIERKDKIA